MSKELSWLAWTVAMTALFWAPYVLNRGAVRGVWGIFANPSANDLPLSPWAQRAQRAHTNAVENLVLFAPAVLCVVADGRTDAVTTTACAVYFWSRLAHFAVYTAGVPVVRTLAFFGGWGATMALVAREVGIL
ncbi:MAG TPA: MAPEG family protein [Rhodanobacteraceae bacterium]|nr:MAPEG family protein [Rhodanobacteraceae bacterium]